MRFTPHVNTPYVSDIDAALPWHVAGPFQPDNPDISITNCVEPIVRHLQSKLRRNRFAHEANRDRLGEEVAHGFTWLRSAAVF